jgi:transcriptional regulator with XRE-family HTH domain
MKHTSTVVDVEFIKSLMKVKNLSESEFAEKIGVTHSTINRVLNGKRGAGNKVVFGILTAFKDVTYSQLVYCIPTLPKGNIKKNKTA